MKCLICGDPSNGRWIIATLWHFRLIDFDQFAFVRGTFKTFGFRSTLTLISPLANTLIHWKHRKAQLKFPDGWKP